MGRKYKGPKCQCCGKPAVYWEAMKVAEDAASMLFKFCADCWFGMGYHQWHGK